MKLNKTTVEGIAEPDKGAVLVWDDALPGFGLRVTSKGVRAYVAQARVHGKTRRVTVGRHGVITADEARKRARTELGRMSDGVDPAEEKQKAAVERQRQQTLALTLRDVWKEYKTSRTSKGLSRKESTLHHMAGHLERNFGDWLDQPIASITREGVRKRHAEIAQRGTNQADQAFRYLRALYNLARETHTLPDGTPQLPANPVNALRASRSWHAPRRRRTVIPRSKLGEVIVALEGIAESPGELTVTHTSADLLLFLLATGLRYSEGAQLRWEDVDTEHWTITLADPKNRRPTTLPLSTVAADVLRRRQATEGYVFPGRSGGYLHDTRGVRHRITRATGVEFTNHDLRRTFVTVAEALEVGEYTLKRLLNHAVSGDDVTGGYIAPDTERLRQAADRVGDFMRERAAATRSANVVDFNRHEVGA